MQARSNVRLSGRVCVEVNRKSTIGNDHRVSSKPTRWSETIPYDPCEAKLSLARPQPHSSVLSALSHPDIECAVLVNAIMESINKMPDSVRRDSDLRQVEIDSMFVRMVIEKSNAQRNACACSIHIRAYSPCCLSSSSCVPASTITDSFIYLVHTRSTSPYAQRRG